MAEEDRLKLYWEHFFKAETGTYEKSTWLDLFLADFLIRLKEGVDPRELINFCPVSGVVSLVGCELLCGIHRVTSSQRSQCRPVTTACSARPEGVQAAEAGAAEADLPPPQGTRARPASLFSRANSQPPSDVLTEYLLGGVAWRCLLLLRALGVEGASCCRQLSSVLIWVFGELTAEGAGKGKGGSAAPRGSRPSPARPRTPIHELFSHRIWSKRSPAGSQTQSSFERSSVTGRFRQTNSETKSKRKVVKQSDHSSDSGDSNSDLQMLNRTLTIKVCTPEDFTYFDSPARTPGDYSDTLYIDPFHSPKKPKPKANDYMNEQHKEIINTQLTTFEFTSLIVELLQELCKTESSLSGSEGSQISVQCINFSLRNLCSLQFGSIPQSVQFNSEEVSTMKVFLTELLIVSLDKVLVHSDLCAKLINNGILPMLLRILEDVICKLSNKYKDCAKDQKETEKPSKTEADNMLRFLFGIGYSITAFFHCLLVQCRTIEKLREFTDQFKLYGECLKGGLLKDCIELMVRIPGVDQAEVVILIKKLIESLGRLINGMKRVRSEVVHSAACPRSRHKVCRQRVMAGMHHHHDILGEAGTGLPLSSACCISVLYGTLTSLVCDDEVSAVAPVRTKILRVMLNSGVCCCFSPGFLMESIVRLMLTHNSVANLCLQVLEHTVYGELGASVLMPKLTDQLPCSVCEPSDDNRGYVRKYCPHGVSPDRKSVWAFLIHYNSLLQLDNHNNVLHATVSHLLRITPKCRTEMKHELLFSVIYPTFIVAKHRYIIRLEESAYFLTVSCLNIFASLLNTVSFAEQFIQKGGLSYVLELVSLSEYSNQCCSILEIAIIVEIYKLLKENADVTFYREINSLLSVQMLLKSLSEMTDKCYKIYKLKLPEDVFEQLCDINKERESLAFTATRRSEPSRKSSMPKSIAMKQPTNFVFTENVLEEAIEDFIEVLKTIWTFWKTCASVCLYSPMFRQFVVTEVVFEDSYALLKLLLYHLCHCESSPGELKVTIRILEALLTVQFSVADVTSGRSKETSCQVIRSSLSADKGALFREGGAGLRALCEALIRVCVARPSPTHAMPRAIAAKVPPLECASGGSSAECSSSEESAGRVYSEHSEPRAALPSDGYEADVEFGKLELLAAMKSKKMSASLSTVNAINGNGGNQWLLEEDGCAEYVRAGDLAHPELCAIVVDILAQLIHKVMSTPAECAGEAVSAAASLARASCGRLGGALGAGGGRGAGAGAGGGPGPMPPPLLPRLLPAAAPLLVSNEPHLAEVQSSVLELVVVLGSSGGVEPASLWQLLRALTTPRPAVHRVLTALQRLAEQAQPFTPLHIVTFPIDATHTADNELSPAEALNFVVVNTSQSQQADARAQALHDAHVRAGIVSPWSVCAARCGVEGSGWAGWLQGFGVLLWARPAEGPAPGPGPHRPGPGAQPAAGAGAGHTQRPERRCANGDAVSDCDSPAPWPRDRGSAKRESAGPVPSPSPPRPSDLLHVFSVGHDSLIFEIWLDANTGSLSFRLSRPDPGSHRVVSAAVPAALPAGRWSCVAANVRELVLKRRAHIQVTVYVNGCETDTVLLPVQGILVRKAMPVHALLGHVCADGGPAVNGAGGYHLSQLAVLRSPVLTAAAAMHVAACGPDHCCQVSCETPNFSPLLTGPAVSGPTDWDQVFDPSRDSLRDLHDSVLLTFAAHSPHILNLYHQTTAMTNVFAGRLTPPASSGGASIPESLSLRWAGSGRGRERERERERESGGAGPHCSRSQALPPAVSLLGGPDVLLYLFARVVELEAPAAEQATALSVLLRVCRVDSQLYGALYGDDSLDMLLTVFASPKCRMSPHMVKAILDDACSETVVTWSGPASVLRVMSGAGAVLREPRLLLLLVAAWRHLDTDADDNAAQQVTWEVESSPGFRQCHQGSLWALTLCAISALVSEGMDPAIRAFNHYQMTRVGLMRHLLTACKERFLCMDRGPLDAAASRGLVRLVRALMGTPPLLDRLAMLTDFLLLMHQASDTFVTHSRANFYFLLTADTQETSDYRRDSFTRRTNKRRQKPKDPDMASSSSVTSEDISETLLKELTLEDKLDQSSAESTKHMKGILNMQIKEGRKHKLSSTSENSDILNDKPEAISEDVDDSKEEPIQGEGEGEYAATSENGPVDDAMYSSVYHQRRVLAGAERGWSACEGLLRLLRDTLNGLGDHDAAQAVSHAVRPETLLVLANHSTSGVRTAVVRALTAAHRARGGLGRNDERSGGGKRRDQQYYYLHLANQISLYRGSWELAAACAELVTGCDVPLEDQCDDALWQDVTDEALARCPPLVALLPTCLHDVPLAHNLMLLIRKVIDKASLKTLSELSVAEVVVRCVGAVRAAGAGAGAGSGQRERAALLRADLHELLDRLAGRALAQPHGMQTIVDIHHMLSFAERSAGGAAAALAARAAQCSLLAAQLARLEERLHCSYSAHSTYTNYFTTAVSLGAESAARSERADLATRHLAVVSRAVSFLVAPSDHRDPELEGALLDRLLHTLLPAVCGGASTPWPKWWAGVGVGGVGGGEWLRPLQQLVWWAASPAPAARPLQPRLLAALYRAPQAALTALQPTDPPTMRKLAVYLLTLLQHIHAMGERGHEHEQGGPVVELAITDWARGWAVGSQAALPERLAAHCLNDEAARLLAADEERWAKAVHKQKPSIAKVVFAKDALANKLTESAMGITRQVVDIQNAERKAFMEHLRRAHSEAVAAAQRWQRLIDSYTHEEAVWHDPLSYPQSWQLDATEGPGRVRVRLKRAHLHIHPRFLKPEHRHKAERGSVPRPLGSVVGAGRGRGGALAARLRLHETVSHTARVTYVTVASETDGELLLSDRSIHFVPEDCPEDPSKQPQQQRPAAGAHSWPLEAVVQVSPRRWCLQERAAELFLSSGQAHLVAFADVTERTAFLRALDKCHLPNRTEPDTLAEAMNQWRSGAITNWEYLMRLNGLAGRSYNDLMQYPVLPFVIADYCSRILDLNDPASFRDLSRPMAIQDKAREQHYINTYNDLSSARREGCSPLLSRQPHHYASLYSNSGGVLHYLVRLPPFTELFLQYQDNNFDMPDRTFHSLATTWRLITRDSPTDVKELIPELFYLPELFHNNEGLNLGSRQCGAAVDSVELPPWAADARLFTLAHRQALEAAPVSDALPHWIDLVFGYKQTGQAAIDAVNVFPACTYYGFDPLSLAGADELDRLAAAAMVRSYGQAPRQLLCQPHPHRATDLAVPPRQPPAYDGVSGVAWGRYCGSPALPPPGAAPLPARRAAPLPAAAVLPLPHPRSGAIATLNTTLMPISGSGSGSGVGSGSNGAAVSVAIVSWGHADRVLRVKRRRDLPPEPLLLLPPLHQITVVTSCIMAGPSCPVVMGLSSGMVLCVRLRHDPLAPAAPPPPAAAPAAPPPPPPRAHVRPLLAHRAPITAVALAARAGVIVTASSDGKIVVWDLNRLSYIRTLPNRDNLSVSHVAVSETLCDVASVHEPARDGDSSAYETDRDGKYQSLIRVHTVNARYVGSVKVPELVTCICYSAAPEGVTVNVIAAGTRGGAVRLYSSWELRPAGNIASAAARPGIPLVSLAYSSDSSVLFACYADGACVAWESETGRSSPRLIPAHALL